MAASMDMEDIVLTFPPSPRRRSHTIPGVLAARRLGTTTNPRLVTTKLSSNVAWNVSRMQNMVVAVGPGTPAALDAAMHPSSSLSSSDDGDDASMHDEQQQDDEESNGNNDDQDMDDDDDESTSSVNTADLVARAEDTIRECLRPLVGDAADTTEAVQRSSDMVERIVLEYLEANDDDDDDSRQAIIRQEPTTTTSGQSFVPSIRHGGCINTATWLTSPWRLSLAGHDSSSAIAIDSEDCPTQLITSGDDRTIKFWDVRHAMGTANPLPGGKYSHPPFADTSDCKVYDWKQHVNTSTPLAGSVIPLASLSTGHRANVFHVTPVDAHPGKVVSCGADGYLRMADVNRPTETSTIIVSPEHMFGADDMLTIGLFGLRASNMCFSHHFINANTGLLCGEHGLYRFDLRLSPREQSSRSLLGNDDSCKSCAIWSASSSLENVDSAYVFAGGASPDVTLYDLRMTDGSTSKIVQKYRPSGLRAKSEVSVSGLDVSKDKRELLVSYENDQIFSFPVFPFTSGGTPSVDELGEYSNAYSNEDEDGPILSELAAYGGHLNRFTFLKNAKYAGPRDEYICTGSDSGRAWFYERATGTVAAFLAADQSTCNGVIPHPSLPFFITYGIDSTAKLWRATNPVDRDADDSPLGRARQYHRHQYEKSALVKSWAYTKATAGSIASLEEEEEAFTMYPDQFPVSDSPTIGNSILGGLLMRRRMFGIRGARSSGICNDLRELPNILQKNLFSCVIASEEGESEPVSSGLGDLARRMSTIRLRFQADQRGLTWNADDPWVFGSHDIYKGKELAEPSAKKTDGKRESTLYGNASDLIPDSPCDWVPYDPDMNKNPRPFGPRFNTEDYADFYSERYAELRRATKEVGTTERSLWAKRVKQQGSNDETTVPRDDAAAEAPEDAIQYDSERALKYLHDTALMLKEGGNAALEAGSIMEAARRYDCAIRYCSVALLNHPKANEDFLRATEKKWCPIRKVLVTTRLNLCLVLANFDLRAAREQATLALKELAPFCSQPGKVLSGKKLALVHNDNEPMSTYQETKELEAKAYFRCGSVEMKVGNYEEATEKLELSIKSTKELSKEPDRILLRRLAEAKREKARKSKRQKKKFKRKLGDWEGLCPPAASKEKNGS